MWSSANYFKQTFLLPPSTKEMLPYFSEVYKCKQINVHEKITAVVFLTCLN